MNDEPMTYDFAVTIVTPIGDYMNTYLDVPRELFVKWLSMLNNYSVNSEMGSL